MCRTSQTATATQIATATHVCCSRLPPNSPSRYGRMSKSPRFKGAVPGPMIAALGPSRSLGDQGEPRAWGRDGGGVGYGRFWVPGRRPRRIGASRYANSPDTTSFHKLLAPEVGTLANKAHRMGGGKARRLQRLKNWATLTILGSVTDDSRKSLSPVRKDPPRRRAPLGEWGDP